MLRVPVSKSGKPRTIALNTAAMAVLKSIPRDPACPYIFPTRLIGVYNPGTASDAAQDWPTSGCMTFVTRLRACSSTGASRSTWCKGCLGTPRRG